jgi:hypothetical protein
LISPFKTFTDRRNIHESPIIRLAAVIETDRDKTVYISCPAHLLINTAVGLQLLSISDLRKSSPVLSSSEAPMSIITLLTIYHLKTDQLIPSTIFLLKRSLGIPLVSLIMCPGFALRPCSTGVSVDGSSWRPLRVRFQKATCSTLPIFLLHRLSITQLKDWILVSLALINCHRKLVL